MNILVIDDERTFSLADNIIYARTLGEARRYIWADTLYWDRIYLDHDLGGEDVIDLVRDIEWEAGAHSIYVNVDRFVIHSMNPVGRENMAAGLRRFYNVEFARVEDLL